MRARLLGHLGAPRRSPSRSRLTTRSPSFSISNAFASVRLADVRPTATGADGPKLPPFYFIVTFWGKRYREWFCRYPLASLLAEGNIPSLRDKGHCRFVICTSPADWRALQRDPL